MDGFLAFCGLTGSKDDRAGPSGLKLPPPKKEGFHLEANPTKWFQKGISAEQREADLKKLSSQIDVDAMRAAFIKHAGPDELMDQNEFERFAKAMDIMKIAPTLWNAMDNDRSGSVDKEEFYHALHNLTTARAWLRFCPTCMFENECEMCIKSADCDDCTEQRFCVKHWAEHPGNTLAADLKNKE